MTVQEMGKLIRSRRRLLKLKQEDLSKISGISLKTIHLMESGTGNPSAETLSKVAEGVGLEIALQVRKMN